MKFSSKSEYGVRVMAELARHFGRGPVSLTEVSRDEDLPLAYLEHIVASLRKGGLVVSQHGARGGYVLARPPGEITIAEVVRVLEGPIAPMVCASEVPEALRDQHCAREAYCTSKLVWVRVRESIASALSAMTVADLVPAGGPAPMMGTYSGVVDLPVVACADAQISTRVSR